MAISKAHKLNIDSRTGEKQCPKNMNLPSQTNMKNKINIKETNAPQVIWFTLLVLPVGIYLWALMISSVIELFI